MLITLKDLKRILAVCFFAAGYHAIYVAYLNPVFDYAYYRLENREWFQWVAVYLIVLTPSVWQRSICNAVASGISLIYLLVYVPALITMSAMWIKPFSEFILVAISLMIGQFIIQLYPLKRPATCNPIINSQQLTQGIKTFVAILTFISLTVFIIENKSHMRLVGFEDVYDLRFASRDASSLLSGYLSMWLLGVSVPFYLSLFIQRKNWKSLFLAILISILLYMGNGAKSALLMPIQALIVAFLVAKGRNPTQFLGLLLGLTMWILYLADFEWLNIFKSLLIMRLLSTGGWTLTTYYEFFSFNGWTYYSHVNIIGSFLGKEYSTELGKLIGIEYFSSEDANFNANFWATDGIAAFGIIGIIFASFLMGYVLRIISKLSLHLDQRATAVLLSGFWLSILNSSIFTSMLSGGGLLILLIIYFQNQFILSKLRLSTKRNNQ